MRVAWQIGPSPIERAAETILELQHGDMLCSLEGDNKDGIRSLEEGFQYISESAVMERDQSRRGDDLWLFGNFLRHRVEFSPRDTGVDALPDNTAVKYAFRGGWSEDSCYRFRRFLESVLAIDQIAPKTLADPPGIASDTGGGGLSAYASLFIWVLYVDFECSLGRLQAAKRVFYRAMYSVSD